MRINLEYQHFKGCPNSPKFLNNIKAALEYFIHDYTFNEIYVEDEQSAINYKFRGSPSFLLNGIDFENMPAPDNPSLSCRYYQNGIPSTELIIKKLEDLVNES